MTCKTGGHRLYDPLTGNILLCTLYDSVSVRDWLDRILSLSESLADNAATSSITLLRSDDKNEGEAPSLPICHPPLLPGPTLLSGMDIWRQRVSMRCPNIFYRRETKLRHNRRFGSS